MILDVQTKILLHDKTQLLTASLQVTWHSITLHSVRWFSWKNFVCIDVSALKDSCLQTYTSTTYYATWQYYKRQKYTENELSSRSRTEEVDHCCTRSNITSHIPSTYIPVSGEPTTTYDWSCLSHQKHFSNATTNFRCEAALLQHTVWTRWKWEGDRSPSFDMNIGTQRSLQPHFLSSRSAFTKAPTPVFSSRRTFLRRVFWRNQHITSFASLHIKL